MKYLIENIDLMSYKINFKYEKKAVYHSIFGLFVSFCIYAGLIGLTQYFAKDFFNKTNPRITYQETEFIENIKIPVDFLLDDYNYSISFETTENLYNLSSNEKTKVINNQTNNFFSLILSLEYKQNLTYFEMIDEINITSERKIKNGTQFFLHSIQKNTNKKKFNLYVYNRNDNEKIIFSKKDVLYNDYEVEITPEILIKLSINNTSESIRNIQVSSFSVFNTDSIINANKKEFFNFFTKETGLNTGEGLNFPQRLSFNYGLVKLLDDSGIIFSQKSIEYGIRKRTSSTSLNNKDENLTLFEIEFNPVFKLYERIYKKLQNVLADLGGLLNSLILIGNILVLPFNKKKFEYDLINKTFYVKHEDDKQIKSPIKNVSIDNEKNKIRNVNLENLSIIIDDNKNKKLEKAESFLSIKDSINKDKCKLNGNSFKNIKSNLYSNHGIFDKNSSILSYSYQFANKMSFKTKMINDSSIRLKGELEEPKNKSEKISKFKKANWIKEDKNSYLKKIDNPLNYSNYDVNEKNLKERIESILKNKKKTTNRRKFVKFSKYEFFLKFFPCKSLKPESLIEKENLITKAELKIAEYLDICNYTNLIENFEKLKLIILNNYQNFSFEFLKNRDPDTLFNDQYTKNTIDTIQYFKHKIKRSNLNFYDKELLENFSNEFKQLIYN